MTWFDTADKYSDILFRPLKSGTRGRVLSTHRHDLSTRGRVLSRWGRDLSGRKRVN